MIFGFTTKILKSASLKTLLLLLLCLISFQAQAICIEQGDTIIGLDTLESKEDYSEEDTFVVINPYADLDRLIEENGDWSQYDLDEEELAQAKNWKEKIEMGVNKLLNAPMFKKSQVALVIYNLDDKEIVYEYKADQLLNPASVAKVITASTALNNLGSDHEFRTAIFYTGDIQDSVLVGDIYIKGGFDPLFGENEMRELVNNFREKEIYKIEGNIYVDLSLKDSLKWGEGWCWDDDEATLTPLLYDQKDIFMKKFMERLDFEGIEHPATYGKKLMPAHHTKKLAICKHTIKDMITPMLKRSINLYAESLFYQLGADDEHPFASAKLSSQKIKEFIAKKIGLNNVNDYSFIDGSGLSRLNYYSPMMVVNVLKYAEKHPKIYHTLFDALPIAGVDGTLRKRMIDTPAQDNVHAKTGTLTRVSALAGYATNAEYKRLAFCIFNSGIDVSKAREFQDKVCILMTK